MFRFPSIHSIFSSPILLQKKNPAYKSINASSIIIIPKKQKDWFYPVYLAACCTIIWICYKVL